MRLLSPLRAAISIVASSRMSTVPNSSNRGAFILFEGGDRCGKSTQTKLIQESLAERGVVVEGIRFPDRTSTIGQMINNYLASTTDMDDRTIHLLFSANRWEAAKSIEAKLAEGTTLICDRYAYSGAAFTAAKGYDLEWCKSPDKGLPAPDAIVFLDMPVEEAAKRGDFGGERYEKIDFQKSVKAKYMELQKGDKENLPWYVIDANQEIEAVQKEVAIIVDDVRELCKTKAVSKLWQ
jgi:dTMP kinase